jgi:cytochrome c oxidase subunit II
LEPHSPATDQIETLFGIGFVAFAIVVVAVNGALIYALRRRRVGRGAPPADSELSRGKRPQLRAGAALGIFAAAILVLSLVFTERARETPATGSAGLQSRSSEPLTIKATGQQWLWRYEYPNGAFSYYKLVVPVDTAVELELDSTDVIHTWNVPSLAGKRDAVPGKVHEVSFLADDEGSYTGRTATLSGTAYAAMGTEVEVVSPGEYESYVKQLGADIQAAQDEVVGQIESGETP